MTPHRTKGATIILGAVFAFPAPARAEMLTILCAIPGHQDMQQVFLVDLTNKTISASEGGMADRAYGPLAAQISDSSIAWTVDWSRINGKRIIGHFSINRYSGQVTEGKMPMSWFCQRKTREF
jgi:hypothetical protein